MGSEGTPFKRRSLSDMAKRKDVSGKRQAAIPFEGDEAHPGGVTTEEIAKVLSDVEECFRRQSEFFGRMARRGRARLHHRNSR